MAGPRLQSEEVDGKTSWFAEAPRGSRARSLKVDLLQPYDEYFVAYTESRNAIDASGRVASHKGRPAPSVTRCLAPSASRDDLSSPYEDVMQPR